MLLFGSWVSKLVLNERHVDPNTEPETTKKSYGQGIRCGFLEVVFLASLCCRCEARLHGKANNGYSPEPVGQPAE